jgi:hypothetical protein
VAKIVPTSLDEPLERLRQQPQLVERAAAGDPDREDPSEQRDGVDRLAPVLVPVVVVQIEP